MAEMTGLKGEKVRLRDQQLAGVLSRWSPAGADLPWCRTRVQPPAHPLWHRLNRLGRLPAPHPQRAGRNPWPSGAAPSGPGGHSGR